MREREQRGAAADAAVRDTLIRIGRKRDREMRMTQWLEDLRNDVRFALRQMWRAPGFTAVAALTLALGIGANSAIFALADGVLLRPLPFPHADRLVTIGEWGPGQGGRSRVELLNIEEWKRANHTLEALAAVWVPAGNGNGAFTRDDGTVETIAEQSVASSFFDTLGITATLGRTFVTADEGTDPRALVLSEGFWQSRFAGDASVIGRTITVGGRPHTVVGVVPDSFEFIRPASVWVLALALAMAGVFGVLSYAVEQRRREFGIRMALGASRGDVLRMVLGSAGRLVAAGAVLGLAVAAMLGRTIDTFLFGVPPLDLVTFAAVPTLIAVIAAAAAAVPASRAARVDPIVVFRQE
jgi:hypothetical protein